MLTDDARVALNDLLAACATSADLHDWAAEHSESEALRAVARDAARERHDAIGRLAEHMRAQDAPPRVPDPESAGFQAVVTGLRAFVAGAVAQARREAIVDALVDAERAVQEAIETARGEAPPAATGAELDRLSDAVRAQLEQLREA